MLKDENSVAGLAVEELSAIDVIPFLHCGQSSVVTFHDKNPTFRNLGGVPIRELRGKWPVLEPYLKHDFYFGINSVYEVENLKLSAKETGLPIYQRGVDRLRWLNAVYVDVDAHEQPDVDFKLLTGNLLSEIQDRGVPPPGLLVSSGRGVWLLWPLRDERDAGSPVKAFPEKCELYQRINRTLAEMLAFLGADSQSTDPARVMRVPGSLNRALPKGTSRVRFFRHSNERYTLSRLCAALRIRNGKVERADQFGPKDPQKVNAGRQRWQTPLEGFIRLLDLRRFINKGVRHNALFIYSFLLLRNQYDKQRIREQVERAARICSPPLSQDEVNRCVKSAIRTAARGPFENSISNAKIAQMLGITSREKLELTPWFKRDREARADLNARRQQAIVEELRSHRCKTQLAQLIPSREMARVLADKYQISVSHTTVLKDYRILQMNSELFATPTTRKNAPWKELHRCRSTSPSLSYQHPKLSDLIPPSLSKIETTLEDTLSRSNFNNQCEDAPYQNDIMTPSEAAAYLRISIATLLRQARAGKIPGHLVGKLWRFRRSELDEWLR